METNLQTASEPAVASSDLLAELLAILVEENLSPPYRATRSLKPGKWIVYSNVNANVVATMNSAPSAQAFARLLNSTANTEVSHGVRHERN